MASLSSSLRLLPLSILCVPAVSALPSSKSIRADPAYTLLGCFTDNDAGSDASTAGDDMIIA
jgi:hypothetical protein